MKKSILVLYLKNVQHAVFSSEKNNTLMDLCYDNNAKVIKNTLENLKEKNYSIKQNWIEAYDK